MTYYDSLHLSKNATISDIKVAFRSLSKKFHPDVGGDAEKFKLISEAYDTLSNPEKKEKYDASLRQREQPKPYKSYRNDDDFQFDDSIFRQYSDLKKSNVDTYLSVHIPITSIISDQKKYININGKPFEITIPAGINSGAIIKFNGLGSTKYTGVPPGNLIVEINVNDTDKFIRDGNNVISDVTISSLEAIAGTTIEFVTIRGKTIKVTIPRGVQYGSILRIVNEGLPKFGSTDNGHQLLKIKLQTPILTSEECQLIQKILNHSI